MDTPFVPRNPGWRHGVRLIRTGVSPARRRGTAAMGGRGGSLRPRAALAPRCPSLPRLAFSPF